MSGKLSVENRRTKKMLMIFIWIFLIVCYLVGKLSYEYGKKEEWRKISKEYICIHKSVCVKPCKKEQKTIDKCSKNKYNKKAYRQKSNVKQ